MTDSLTARNAQEIFRNSGAYKHRDVQNEFIVAILLSCFLTKIHTSTLRHTRVKNAALRASH